MSVFNDTYFNELGILALAVNSPRLAIDYFRRTSINVNEKYRLNLGVSYVEAGLFEPAREIFRSLIKSTDESIKAVSMEYLEILNWDSHDDIDTLNDEQKYMLFHVLFKRHDSVMSDKLLNSIENRSIQILAEIERIEYLVEVKNIGEALERFKRIGLISVPPVLKERKNRLEYLLALNESIADIRPSGQNPLSTNDPLYLYDQLLSVKSLSDQKDTIRLDSVYNMLASWDPFFEEGVIAAVQYFNDSRNEENYAYNLLVNALTVNSYSEALNKFYIEYCLNDGLIDFARNRLEFMKVNMEVEGFDEYYRIASEDISRREEEMNTW
jgi:hypothetical protein